jgi:hypothetical protein
LQLLLNNGAPAVALPVCARATLSEALAARASTVRRKSGTSDHDLNAGGLRSDIGAHPVEVETRLYRCDPVLAFGQTA